ncbi:MAG: zinc ribbon domain-containing protein [Candidatus Eisenbacteria bacterium]|jgi:putative FmdB family regulatory protein|nr:zinc ribbon domain-containing protein [Candidatus Eisenbacteria bacterium]
MPTYEFHCTACGKEFTTILSISARGEESIACPHCGSKRVEQQYTAVSVKTGKKTW